MKKFSWVQIGIVAATIATAIIHISLYPDIMFTLNGLGYLGLLGAYFLPIPFFASRHKWVWWGLLGYTLLTILQWVQLGVKTWPEGAIGYYAKAVEVVLVALLWADRK
jgi:hypothetical protein